MSYFINGHIYAYAYYIYMYEFWECVLIKFISLKKWTKRLPWSSGKECAFPCRGRGLDPARGTEIPHATGQLSPNAPQLMSPRTSTREPTCRKLQSPCALEPCATAREKSMHRNKEPVSRNKRSLVPQLRSDAAKKKEKNKYGKILSF